VLAAVDVLTPLLRSPVTGGALRAVGGQYVDDAAHPPVTFPCIDGKPVLIDFSRSIFREQDMMSAAAASEVPRTAWSGWVAPLKRMVSPPKGITRDMVARLIGMLATAETRPLVLVIGGGTVGQGMEDLYAHPAIQVAALDVYATPLVQVIADAHQVPFADGSFDAVIAQAVLEHVLEPHLVVEEIHRVLKPNALVFAETPFLQHVHEGAYDFTRFTESGHRYLFKNFELIASGVSGGPGTQLLWSIDNFARGLFRSRRAGKITKLLFSWLRFFDDLIPASYASDAASGFYFLGRRSEQPMKAHEIVSFYPGAQGARADR